MFSLSGNDWEETCLAEQMSELTQVAWFMFRIWID